MGNDEGSLFGISLDEQDNLLGSMALANAASSQSQGRERLASRRIAPRLAQFSELPEFKQLQVQRVIATKMNVLDPFFCCHETLAKNTTIIHGEEFLNFSTYDYIGLNGHPEITATAIDTLHRFGTSASASRLVAGERPPHAALEKALAELYKVENAVVFVSGHATNVSTISTIFGPRDAVYHDQLAHNSIILGATLSGATRYSYAHNDCDALELLLQQTRSQYERVLIVTEGLFSMDGNIPDLPRLVALKKQYTCFLMVDEAHALGVLGTTGRGSAEHFGISTRDVDIWMGTLSKTLCGCGGYIAGSNDLIDLLKYRAPGFVYSVGMPPLLAAASAKALELMLREPERTARLQEVSAFFLTEAKARGLNTGHAQGYAIVPIIVGNSLCAAYLASAMFKRRINALPIVYPVVEEGLARLRFFLSCVHSEEDIITALDALTEELPIAEGKVG